MHSIKAAQSEPNESELHTDARRTNERTHHHVTFLNLYINDSPAFSACGHLWVDAVHKQVSLQSVKQLFLESTFNRYKFDIINSFNRYTFDIRNTWKTINEILTGNHKTTCFPNSLNINGNEITNQLHIAT